MSQSTTNLTPFIYNAQNQYLFNRTYSIALGAPNQTSALQYSNLQTTVNGQIFPPAPIRVSFDIDKNFTGATPNMAKFEIWNLSLQNRTKIRTGYLLQMMAGYRGLMNTLFVGNINYKGAKSERKGADIITSFECGDGESAIVMSVLDKSYPAGTTLYQVLEDVAQAMNVSSVVTDSGVDAGTVLGIPSLTFGRGLVVHGSCKDTLTKLLTPKGLRWSVQNGNLIIIPVTAYNGQQAIVVASGSTFDPSSQLTKFNPNNATGLIGTPSMVGQNLEFKSLLNPNIVPGCMIQLICENITLNGFYKVNRAHYIGDTHDNKWQVECEATPIKNQVQIIPVAQGFDFKSAVTGGIA